MKKICMILVFTSLSGLLFSDGSQAFELDLKKEIGFGAAGIGLFTLGYLSKKNSSNTKLNEFGWFDEDLGFALNENLDDVGTVIGLSTLIGLPFLVDEWDVKSISTVSVMFAESFLLAYGIKDILKSGFARARPYNFTGEELPDHIKNDNDRFYSFPSGHTTVAFMTASFSTYVFSQGDMDPRYKWAMGISTFSLATTTAVLRVVSGVHYPTDVLAGALLGGSIGFLVPYLHLNLPENMSLNVTGNSLLLSYRL